MIKYTKFETPVHKSVTEVKVGDVLKCEYGDDDNWITFVLDEIYPCDDGYFYCAKGRYVDSENEHIGYSPKHGGYIVLGHVDKKEG